ncbi:MAG: outer membrane protein assembly factor BamD [Alphaproteobacteria bacterium]|nr:outer membrane protein assembly factor BamD [Alphaproteobacteria bacterium]
MRIVALGLLLLLAACSEDNGEAYRARTVERLYNLGVDALQREDFKGAVLSFDEVERQHPYSVWATKAQLMSAYASYKRDDYDEAIVGLDRFIELHPGNPDVAYAYYLKGVSYYEQISDVGRDQKMTELAREGLQDVIRRYPNNKYGRDARAKLDLVDDHLAGKEMAVGRYYQQRQEFLAAINRFRSVLQNYQRTTHAPEALLRLTESYLSLGITDEAQMAAAVLGHNFPGSKWYEDSYALLEQRNLAPSQKEGSWLSWMWDWAY